LSLHKSDLLLGESLLLVILLKLQLIRQHVLLLLPIGGLRRGVALDPELRHEGLVGRGVGE
jgi:hypothetical protein